MALPVLLGATLPSVDDCSRSAPPTPYSGVAGMPRNGWLASVGITGWFASECPAGMRRNTHADDLMIRVRTAMAQKERELITERTRAALAAAKARGAVLGGDRGYRPLAGPCAAAAASVRGEVAVRTAHRLSLEIDALRQEGVTTLVGLARSLTERGVPTPRGGAVWTHTTVARVLGRVAA